MKIPLVLLVLLGATAFAQEMAGHYVFSMREMAAELMLKPNGRFEFGLAYGAADFTGQGTWKTDNGFVVLNSDIPKSPPFKLVKGGAGSNKDVRVWVKGPGGQPVEHIDVALRTPSGVSTKMTDGDGMALFDGPGTAQAIIFRVAVYDFVSAPFDVNSAHNEFTFEINGDAITQVPFKDEHLKIDGKVLELRFWDKDHPMRFERK